ncbi:hypothetical protein QF021_003917 [Acidovorax delafieldii]|nr:hypothetical protein [Acidovorax delafieldii]
MRRARERSPTRLWITLGTFLEQPVSYPHKTSPPESCCRRAPHLARAAPHTLQRRKCAPALKKKRLSTQTGVLYYYCYLYIKPLKNNQNPQSGHLSTAGDGSIGRLDNLTDRRLLPEWSSNGSACAVLSGGSLTPLRGCKRSCWWGPMPFTPHQRMQCFRHLGHPIRLQPGGRALSHQLRPNPCSQGEGAWFPLICYQLMSIQGMKL